MAQPHDAPYGSWRSPITADLVASASVRIGHLAVDGEDLYWVELRPAEGGRQVIVRRTPEGRTAEVTPAPFNARTRVHEYGGGDFAVAGGVLYSANFSDQRLYRVDTATPGAAPEPITPPGPASRPGSWRYADGVIDRQRKRLICVREDHTAGGRQPVNTLVAIDLAATPNGPAASEGAGEVLVSGNDFYAFPRLSPDGTRLAWLAWNHPNMPWDGTELWTAELDSHGKLGGAVRVAGGPEESIYQPEWSPDGTLYFVSDRAGWWNLYRWPVTGGAVEAVLEMEAEFGRPLWVFGTATYGFQPLGPGGAPEPSPPSIICSYTRDGTWHLARLDPAGPRLELLEGARDYTEILDLRVGPGWVLFKGGSPTAPLSLVRLDLASGRKEVLRRTSDVTLDSGYLSTPQALEFPTSGGRSAHAFYYAPRNRDAQAPPGTRPPLLVKSHGGPTSATSATFSLSVQYWTSRGIAVLDVNYGGSTGYGRAYRERLNGQWGVVDVDDCENGARYLAQRGEVDGERLAISGGSAGGYTTLCALTFRHTFKAGASYFGVSDLETLVTDDHKFESRYLERLIGPYPERRDLYQERSPIHFVDRLSCPIIFLQGLEDVIVPPSQAEVMVAALRAKGLPVAYLPFPGEQHGFRRAEHIKRALEAELYFYSRVFGFPLAEPVEPVEIDNLD
jgi:dienelactone hydrolase